MDSSIILSFGLVMLFATAAGLFSVRLRIPPVAGLLIVGMIIGPHVLNLINSHSIEIFAEIGAILLLFMIGVSFSVTKLLSAGLRTIIGSLVLILIVFTVMHEIAILMGMNGITALFTASVFSMSSTAIMIKLLEQKGFVKRTETKMLITILIVEDVVAVFLLTFLSSIKTTGYTMESVVWSVVFAMGILTIGYVLILAVLNKFSKMFLRYQAEDTLILFSFTLGIGMSGVASILGLTPAIGSFLAGSIIAGLPNNREIEKSIRPFSNLFSSFFFLSIGMLINPIAMVGDFDITFMLIGGFMLTVFLATAFSTFTITSDGRSSVFAGLAMLPLGEFSLLMARESVGLASINLVEIASVGVLISSVACSMTLGRSESAYRSIKNVIPPRFRVAMMELSDYFNGIIAALEPGGYFHKLFISEIKKLSYDAVFMIWTLALFLTLRPNLGFEIMVLGQSFNAEYVSLGILLLLFSVPACQVLLSVKRIFDALSVLFSSSPLTHNHETITRNISLGALFFGIFANFYIIVELLELPKAYNWFSVLFGAFSLIFLWSAVRAAVLAISVKRINGFDISHRKLIATNAIPVAGKRKKKMKT